MPAHGAVISRWLVALITLASPSTPLELHVVGSGPPRSSSVVGGAAAEPPPLLRSVHQVRAAFQRACCDPHTPVARHRQQQQRRRLQQQRGELDCHRLVVYLHPGLHMVDGRPLAVGSSSVSAEALPSPPEARDVGGGGWWCALPLHEEWRGLPTAAGSGGGGGVLLSGGVRVGGPWRETLPGRWVTSLPPSVVGAPKSIRIGGGRAAAARAPEGVGGVGGGHSYAPVLSVVALSDEGLFRIGVNASLLPASWAEWDHARILFFPQMSWFSMWAEILPGTAPLDSRPADGIALFTVRCPHCPPHPNTKMGLAPGSRLTFFGDVRMLRGTPETSGVWAVAGRELTVLSTAMPQDVFVPTSSRIVDIMGRRNVSMSGLTFVDTDFVSSGTQGSFNTQRSAQGCPADAAVAISRSTNVTIANCTQTHAALH
jgi:hypothetical protein